MSNLLEQASLVMIPSGYKEDVVYSEIPINGAGDLSFTRASNGTRINSAGLVEVVPWNLLQYSNAFNTAPWSMNVTSGQAGKDGQNNAWLLTKLGSTTSDYYNSNVYNGDQTFTIYVKKESGKGFKLFPIGTTTTNVEVNLQTGVVLNQGAGITSTTVEAYSSTWWKISVALNMVNSNYYIYVTDGAGTQIAGSITIQDAQVNIGLTAKPYFPTTDRLNVPRLTYQNGGGGCPSLLLEKQSTNTMLNSENLNSWLKLDTSVTSNTITSPDGTQNADTVTATGSGSLSHLIYQNLAFTSGTAHTMSVFAKANTSNFIQLIFSGDFIANSYANFNLSNGTITASANLTPQIESMGNGWYRCSISATAGTSATNSQIIYLINSGTASRGQAFTANGESVYLWGGQFEASSYATSYIPTTSSSATRVADACYKTGISSLIGQTEGVLFADVNWNVKAESGSPVVGILTLNNNVANLCDCIILGIERQSGGNNKVYCLIQNSCSTQAALFGSNISDGRYKIALGYKANDFVLYVNGVQIATDTSGTVPTTSEVLLGQRFQGDSVNLNDTINETILFKTRLTNAELASLTTL